MSNENPNNLREREERLEKDLDAVSGLLDRLVAMDRASADEEFEHRVFGASLAGLKQVVQTEALVSAAAQQDAQAADAELEQRVHATSVERLHAPTLRISDGDSIPLRPVARRSIFSSWHVRSAMAAMFACAVTVGIWKASTQNTARTSRSAATIESLRTHVDRDFDLLLTALGDSSSTASRTADSDSSDAEFKAEWIDDMLEGGASS